MTIARPWVAYLFVILCLSPSLVLFYMMEAGISMVWFGVMIVAMLFFAARLLLTKTPSMDYDEELTFNERFLQHDTSHSQCQLKWGHVDEITETDECFQFYRIARCSILPKRVVGDQLQEFRNLVERCKSVPIENVPAVPFYHQFFETDSMFPVFQFSYQPDDLTTASHMSFRRIDGEHGKTVTDEATPTPNRFSFVFNMLLIAAMTFLLMFVTFEQWQIGEWVWLIPVWMIPVFLIVGGAYLLPRFFRRTQDSKIPNEVQSIRLLEKGWAIGNEAGCMLYDWRDIKEVYDSKLFFGFKSLNDLLLLLPKRIIPDPALQEKFLAQLVDLHRTARHKHDVVTAEVVETGNPYQPPVN